MNNKKIKIGEQTTWDSHFIGWKPAIDALQKFHNPEGILFIGYLDEEAPFKYIKEKYIGFFHHLPNNSENIKNQDWCKNLKGLDFYLETEIWKSNEKKCKGIFTLCKYLAEYIKTKTYVPVENLYFPIPEQKIKFDWWKFLSNKNKKLLHPGNWVRNFNAFNEVRSPYQKAVTAGNWLFQNRNPDIEVLGYMTKEAYEKTICENIVFQCFYDVAASNTIIECISKNIPLIINRLPAAEEYLGKDYPLFYNTISEAENILFEIDKIFNGFKYLEKMNKSHLSLEKFANDFYNSKIYQNIKIPKY